MGATSMSQAPEGFLLRRSDRVENAAWMTPLAIDGSKFKAAANVRADGSKVDIYGPNPKGILIFDGNGRYSLTIMRSDLPKFAASPMTRGPHKRTRLCWQD
jgi:hypothetical protein